MGEHAGSSPSRHIPSGSPRPSHEWQRGAPRQAPDYQSRHTPGVCALPGIVVLPPSVRPSAGHRKATLLPAGGAVLGKGCRFHDRRAAINPFRALRLLAALLESLSAGKEVPHWDPTAPGAKLPFTTPGFIPQASHSSNFTTVFTPTALPTDLARTGSRVWFGCHQCQVSLGTPSPGQLVSLEMSNAHHRSHTRVPCTRHCLCGKTGSALL